MTTVGRGSARRLRRRFGCVAAGLFLALTAITFALAGPRGNSAVTLLSASDGPTTSDSPPTTHSYDDADSGQRLGGASPVIWVLAAALGRLGAIAAILVRSGRPSRGRSL